MNNYGYSSPGNLLGGLAAIVGIIWIISLALGLLMIISQWKIYKKAGKGGWESIVPIYNIIVLIQIVELPMWYIALFFVPIANIYAMFKIYIELAHKFGKSTGFGVATVFFNFICLPILAFGKNNIYNGAQMNNNMQNQTLQHVDSFQSQFNGVTNDQENLDTTSPSMFNQNINTEIKQIQPVQSDNLSNQIQQPMENVTSAVNQEPQLSVLPTVDNQTQPVVTPDNLNNQVNNAEIVSTQPENTLKYEMPTPIVNQEPQLNVIPTIDAPTQPVVTPDNLNNQVNNPEILVNQPENTFKYEIPTPVVSQEPQQNVIPPVDAPTQPVVPIDNLNNQIQQPAQNTTPVVNHTAEQIQPTTALNQNMQPINTQLNVIPGMGSMPQPEFPNSNVGNNQNM